jgi:hypothetical protein
VSTTDEDPSEGLPLCGGGDDDEFVLSPDLANRFWQIAKIIGAAAPSERLPAFCTAARCVAEELIHPEQFPKTEAASRLRAAAEAAGLLRTHDEDFLQKCMSEAFAAALAADQDESNPLNLAPIEEDAVGVDDDDVRPPEFSDEALALKFAKRHGHELKYVAAWNKFYI